MSDVDVTFHGPVFDDAVWDAGSRHYQADMTMDVADQGVRDIRLTEARTFKHPTGWYESHTRAQEQPFSTAIINDSDIVYGPWLEGIGSRNFPVTRFRGYHIYYKEWRRLDESVKQVVQPTTRRFIEEMNAL